MNPSPAQFSKKSAFALVTSLFLMSFLLLLAVALFSLAVVSIRSAEIASARTEAQANAKMALMVALGKLQQTMGPDKRISARASSLAQHPKLETTVTPASGKAWWVGAASSDSEENIGSESRPVVWLVSGLDPGLSSKDQIDQGIVPTIDEVPMFGEMSIDLSLTGGEAITAGAVPIRDENEQIRGSFAYLVDDNGMKAKLVTENLNLLNSNASVLRPGGTVIPGSYDLSILDGMSGFNDIAVENYLKLPSIESLSLLGGDINIADQKRMSYTTQSFGVLTDVKEGRLKRDLTIAFENHTTSSVTKTVGAGWATYTSDYPNMPSYPIFDEVFPKTSDSEWGKYLILDESKTGEFGSEGYIHWGMLRDYYNMKRYIQRDATGRDYLQPIQIWKIGSTAGSYYKGTTPPHNLQVAARHGNLPYGDYYVMPNNYENEFVEYYKHSPLMPIMARMQYNFWLEKEDLNESPVVNNGAIKTNTQLWASHYNPFNISLSTSINNDNSYKLTKMPQVTYSVDSSLTNASVMTKDGYDNIDGDFSIHGLDPSGSGRDFQMDEEVWIIAPGRGQMCGFAEDKAKLNSKLGRSYSPYVKDILDKRVFRGQIELSSPLPDSGYPLSYDWYVDIHTPQPYVGSGLDNRSGMDFEVSQMLWAPIALEPIRSHTSATDYSAPTYGKRVSFEEAFFNDNQLGRFVMKLRSPQESGDDSLRPLVDSNIRGIYFNPRWDSPLNLDMVAPYTWSAGQIDQAGQQPAMSTTVDGTGYSYWGGGDDEFEFDGFDRVILFDIPRRDLVSLGQLQHANVGRFSYEPSYIIGNSYANPRIPLDKWKAEITDTFTTEDKGFVLPDDAIPGTFDLYDASYLVNEALWDGYIFTTIPQVADNYEVGNEPEPDADHFAALLAHEAALPNPRFIPYEPAGSSFDLDTLQRVGDTDEQSAFYHNAGHLMVDGAFNVNSTSVDAWEAFLSSTYGMPHQKLNDLGQVVGYEMPDEQLVRFPRVESVFGGPMKTSDPDENYWIGFRALEQSEVRALAAEIVNQIITRGPFLSLADFVNRKLEDGELGEKGTLQAALDETVNNNPLVDFDSPASHPDLPANSNQGAGFPGQLLQGDILQALSPMMTVRSDTFTIRAYGESLNKVDGELVANVWCEAVVQRYPDPVAPDPNQPYLEELAQPSHPSGRAFRILSFRWLNKSDI